MLSSTIFILIYKIQLTDLSKLKKKVVNVVDKNKFVLNLYIFSKISSSLMFLSFLNAY